MARNRIVEHQHATDLHERIVGYYRQRLSEPAHFPWEGSPYPPVAVGPTWQTTPDGHWLLPERTLGWDVLADCGIWLQHGHDPWRFTDEQARFILWWYALTDEGRYLYRDGVLQRLKGWGKDPVGATIAWVELVGPARFDGWRKDGTPHARDVPDAWVQVSAVALEQTKNTMRLFPGLITDEAQLEFRVHIGKELIHACNDRRLLQAVTSSPTTLEGARATFVIKNETQHWKANNSGHDMADVIERNATKAPDAAARTLALTNAYEPSDDSSAQHDREAWETMAAGRTLGSGLLYDSLEAPPDAPMTAEAAPAVVAGIRGDSVWLDVERIVQSILDPRNPPARSRRWWYNQIVAAEDAWLTPQQVEAAARPALKLAADDDIVCFFDGAKSDDATAFAGCRLSDGHVVTFGVWQRPAGARGEGWVVNRYEVDQRVRAVLDAYPVRAFFADPSHAKDEQDLSGWWDGMIDGWHRDYGDAFWLWSIQSGPERHSVMWDMSSPARTKAFTRAAETFEQDMKNGGVTYDGNTAMKQHLRNARRYPNPYGVSIWKGHRESSRKIDLAVAAVGARMLRRLVLNRGEPPKRGKQPGRVW